MGWYERLAFRFSDRPSPTRTNFLAGQSIRLCWWNARPNLGDAVSPLVVSQLSGRRVVHTRRGASGKLVAIGSILDHAQDGDVVWGSGLITAETRPPGTRLLVTAVRGPRTAKILRDAGIDCPAVYGDPGCLLPRLRPMPANRSPRYALGVIPHYADQEQFSRQDSSVRLLDITCGLDDFLTDLWDCERVVSSSLHGIIFAESYGIPAHWLEISAGVRAKWTDNRAAFKFADYYEGTERDCPAPLTRDAIFSEPTWRPLPSGYPERIAAAFPLPHSETI